MSLHSIKTENHISQSILSIAVGFVFMVVIMRLSEYILARMGLYDAAQPLRIYSGQPVLYVFFIERVVLTILGGYIAAWLAPSRLLLHAVILGGFAAIYRLLSLIDGAQQSYGIAWYMFGLVLLAIPTAWLGGYIYVHMLKKHGE